MTYSQKLKDPRWQKKRLQIFDRDGWKCTVCNDNETTLHVHHSFYKKDAEPWDYQNESLKTLCENCHEAEHKPITITECGGAYIVKEMLDNNPLLKTVFKEIANHKGCWTVKLRSNKPTDILYLAIKKLFELAWYDCHLIIYNVYDKKIFEETENIPQQVLVLEYALSGIDISNEYYSIIEEDE